MAIFSQLARCLVTLYSLSTFVVAGIPWDRQRVMQELDLGDIITLIAERWERVLPAAGVEQGPRQSSQNGNGQIAEDPWSNTRRKVSDIGKWWEEKVAAISTAESDRISGPNLESNMTQNAESSGQQHANDIFEYWPVDAEMLNDNWLGDLMRGGYDFNMAPLF